jgi:hypothetical protein
LLKLAKSTSNQTSFILLVVPAVVVKLPCCLWVLLLASTSTGVEDIDPNSRTADRMYGNVIGDARKLKALEELMGQEWLGTWCGGDRDRNPHDYRHIQTLDS